MQVLEELAGAHPVARLLQERRTLAKVLADFVNTFAHRARRASFGSPGVVRVPFTSAPSQTILHVAVDCIQHISAAVLGPPTDCTMLLLFKAQLGAIQSVLRLE